MLSEEYNGCYLVNRWIQCQLQDLQLNMLLQEQNANTNSSIMLFGGGNGPGAIQHAPTAVEAYDGTYLDSWSTNLTCWKTKFEASVTGTQTAALAIGW
jgi:hypothetical protein